MVVQAYFAAMRMHDIAGNAQTQAGAGAVALLAVTQAHMGLEGRRHGGLRQAGAEVA